MKFFKKILNWWRRLRRRDDISEVIKLQSMSDLPERLSNGIYLIGDPKLKWAVLKCPCGCGDRIYANLMTSRDPVWKLEMTDLGVSLSPSLWMSENKCGSHFFIKSGKIRWV